MTNPLLTQDFSRQKVVDEFSRLYYDDPHTWDEISWMGIPLMKYPTDLIMYTEIIWETRPSLIIECGTAYGGSALFLAHMFDIIGQGGVISIDSHRPEDHNIIKPKHLRVTYLEQISSLSQVAIQEIEKAQDLNKPYTKTMVILDSDHSKEHVLAELDLYHKFVSPGCYLIVEDTNLNSIQARPDYGPGPREALEEWLPYHPEFEVDKRCNRFILTAHPGGYLRRREI